MKLEIRSILCWKDVVKRMFAFFLLMSVVFGLSAQEIAFAAAPVGQVATSAVQSATDCDTMSLPKAAADIPCTGMTADCIAKMGCALPVAIVPPMAFAAPRPYLALAPPVKISPALANRTLGPEPEPPTYLA